jgi:hypothetical protein
MQGEEDLQLLGYVPDDRLSSDFAAIVESARRTIAALG